MQSSVKRHSSQALSLVVVGPIALVACGGGSSKHGPPASTNTPPTGESSFSSAPPGSNGGAQRSASFAGGGFGGGGGLIAGTTAAPANLPNGASLGGPSSGVVSMPRTVQETDLYRLEGTRLYYLNSYRGLMVFDVSNIDSPTLLGRAAIFGDPKDMVVNSSIATVVIGDWYGLNDDGTPFHGSIVRGFDATDPTHIKVLGDAKLGGYVRDDRVVGHVLYAVSQEEPSWVYGWPLGVGGFVGGGGFFGGGGIAVSGGGPVGFPGGFPGGTSNGGIIVSSVDFSNGQIKQISSKTFDGYGGIFNVTSSAILLAHADQPQQPNGPYVPPTKTDLVYLDISDPGGNIVQGGTLQVDGVVGTWGPDNGRWNLDFDGKIAHVVGSPNGQSGGTNATYILATGDFTNPNAPAALSELTIPGANWVPAARFEPNRMYLSPDSNYYYNSSGTTVPIEVFDLSNPAKPQLAGQTQVPGSVWLMIPSNATRLFALGRDERQCSSPIALNYLDVTDPTKPMILGTSTFGEGWASTPAQDTFKAFVMDPNKLGPNNGLVLLPFSGWDAAAGAYNNGVQLIEFTPSALSTGGAAHTKGWVERGIFVGNRVVSLSDLALSVVDYSNPTNPQVTAELTLARSVSTAQPTGATIAEVSCDFWDNDKSHSDVRILPISDAEEKFDESGALDTTVGGTNPRVFPNGNLDYIVTDVQVTVPCNSGPGNPVGVATPASRPGGAASCSTASPPPSCTGWQQQIQVVDLSNSGATLRGQLVLPIDSNYYGWSWGWYGCYDYDWYNGGDVVQVGKTTLAFRRWSQTYAPNGQFVDTSSDLYVVDLSNPDKPDFASLIITKDPTAWWGNMRVVGDTLYTAHTEWIGQVVSGPTVVEPKVRYWLDRIDLSDPKNPRIESSINVPGVLVGGSASDPTVIYTINYYYDSSSSNSNTTRNEFDVLKVYNGKAYLQSQTSLDGYVGDVIVVGTTAYMSASIYPDKQQSGAPSVELHQIDLSDPSHPVDRVASDQKGWGWLLAVEGDRAMVTSGWGQGGLDIYKLTSNAAPVYDQFVRTRGWGWGTQSLSRQDNQLFVSSGYWGVQAVTLQ
jgi:hypothetical protein